MNTNGKGLFYVVVMLLFLVITVDMTWSVSTKKMNLFH